MRTLEQLPVELLYEVYMYSGCHNLPLASKHLYNVFKCAPTTVHAEYLLARTVDTQGRIRPTRSLFTRLLRNRQCTQAVLDAICRIPCIAAPCRDNGPPVELPRRLFRTLRPRSANVWMSQDPPLPFLRYLYHHPRISPPDPNSNGGYALTKAVAAGFTPLVRFLLDKGASPNCKEGIAVHVAIQRKDLALVKLLVEPDSTPVHKQEAEAERTGGSGLGKRKQSAASEDDVGKSTKKRKLEDRIKLNQAMLKTAVTCDARDIVKYLMEEKSVMPDMQTLRHMNGQ